MTNLRTIAVTALPHKPDITAEGTLFPHQDKLCVTKGSKVLAHKYVIIVLFTCRICDALMKANEHIKFQGKENELIISETIHDMQAFQQLNDSVSTLQLTFRFRDTKHFKIS